MSGMIAVSPPTSAMSLSTQPSLMPATIGSKQLRIVLPHRHVVEKEQRLRPAAKHVVDAHRHQVDADRVVHAGQLGDLQLRADAVGARDQHRLLILPRKQPIRQSRAETARQTRPPPAAPAANASAATAAAAATSTRVDVEIDAGIFVSCFGHGHQGAQRARRSAGRDFVQSIISDTLPMRCTKRFAETDLT